MRQHINSILEGIIMNTAVRFNHVLAVILDDAMVQKGLLPSRSYLIKKTDILSYYRETKQTFLNLGSLLISQTDGRFFIFDHNGELVGIDRIKL